MESQRKPLELILNFVSLRAVSCINSHCIRFVSNQYVILLLRHVCKKFRPSLVPSHPDLFRGDWGRG